MKLSSSLDGLTSSVDKLIDRIDTFEEIRVEGIDKRVKELETWKNQISGGWKLATIIWIVLTGGIVALLKYLFG